MNFTHQSDLVLGQFNGRFVFRASLDSEPLPLSILTDLANGGDNALLDITLRHEYFHWLVFRNSPFGGETVGRRFRARSEFLSSNFEEVRKYYMQRTAYFSAAWQTHEDIVKNLESKHLKTTPNQLRNISLSKTDLQQLRAADAVATNATLELKALSPAFTRTLDSMKGRLVSKEFGLQSYAIDDVGKPTLREVSLSSGSDGVINSAFDQHGARGSKLMELAKTARKFLNTEKRAGGLTITKLSHWAVLKFSTEQQTIGSLQSSGVQVPTIFSNKGAWAKSTADFVFRHTLAKIDPIDSNNLKELILYCGDILDASNPQSDAAGMFAKLDQRILYFFYVHGN
jgi:hypothetical protein